MTPKDLIWRQTKQSFRWVNYESEIYDEIFFLNRDQNNEVFPTYLLLHTLDFPPL